MTRRSLAGIFGGGLFAVVFLTSFFLAAQKPFWLDEHYSLTKAILGYSYSQIWRGQLTKEGNNSPFFYVTQKWLCDLVSYSPASLQALKGRAVRAKEPGTSRVVNAWIFPEIIFYYDPFSTSYLRLISIFFMALAPSVLFYYFARRYSLWWGSYAFLLCVSSWFFWWYGLEARPYIHVLALTVLQMILALELLRGSYRTKILWVLLGGVNILLALTASTSAIQILVIACFLLWAKPAYLSFSRMIVVFIVPSLIIGYYYYWVIKLNCGFHQPLHKYFLAVMPVEILAIMGLSALTFLWDQKPFSEEDLTAGGLLMVTAGIAALYMTCLLYFYFVQPPEGKRWAYFYERYLIALVPVGVIAMTVLSRQLLRVVRLGWVQTGLIVLFVLIVIVRLWITYQRVHYWIGF